MNNLIITCNAGSSNTKLAAFDTKTLERKGHSTAHNAAEADEWLCSIGSLGAVSAIGHRVVHGGRDFIQPTHITPDVLDKLKGYIPLAPLHQPAAIKLIEETQKLYPDVSHIACFDTAFHHTMPDIYRQFALPQRFYDEGVMRYGFHGLSYQHIADVMPEELHDKRVIVAHLGGGGIGLRYAQASKRCQHHGLFHAGWADDGHALRRNRSRCVALFIAGKEHDHAGTQ
jgi:acetate kinase